MRLALRFHPDTSAKDRVCRDPTVDATAVVANLETLALDRFYQVYVLVAVDFAQDDVANLERSRIINRFDCTKLSRLDLADHRVAARTELYSLTVLQLLNVLRCPAHVFSAA